MSRFSGYIIAFVILSLLSAVQTAGGQVWIPGRSIVADTAKADSSAKKPAAMLVSNTKKSTSAPTSHSQQCITVTKEGQRKCLQIDTVNVYHTDTVTIAGKNIVHTDTVVRYDTIYTPAPKVPEVKSGFPVWRTIGGVVVIGAVVTAVVLASKGSKGCASSSSASSAGGAAASAAAGCGSSSSSSSSHNMLFGWKFGF